MDAAQHSNSATLPAYSMVGDLRQNAVRWLVICLVMLVWGVTDVRKRAVVDAARPDRHMTDFTCFTLAGEALLRREDPYAISNIRGWPYVYLPMFAILVAPLSLVDPQTQAFIWFVISAMTLYGCYFEIRKLLDACRDRIPVDVAAAIPTLLILAGLVALFPTLNCLQRGQVGVLKLYGVLLGARLLVSSRGASQSFLGGFVLAFPVVLKLTPALPVFCILLWFWGPLLFKTVASLTASIARSPLPAAGWLQSINQAISSLSKKLSRVNPELTSDRFVSSANARSVFGSAASTGIHPASPFTAAMGLACGGLFFVLLLPAAVSGWNQNLAHLRSFADKVLFPAREVYAADFGGDVYSVRNQSLGNAALRAGNFAAAAMGLADDDERLDRNEVRVADTVMGGPTAQRAVTVVRYGLLLMTLFAVGLLSFDQRPASLIMAMSLGLVASLVVAPVARGHYFMLLAPAIVFAPIWLAVSGRRATFQKVLRTVPIRAARWHSGAVAGAFLAAVSIFHYAALPLSGRLGMLGLATAAWLAVTSGIIVYRQISAALQSGENRPINPHHTDGATRSTDQSAESRAA